jgi:hypothetical protein
MGYWRLRYITDLERVEIRVLADYSNSEEPQGQSSRGRVSEEICGFINPVLCMYEISLSKPQHPKMA